MQIERISYRKTFNLGNYSSESIGVDILLNEGEDAKQALEEAKKLVIEYHKENNPQIYEEQDYEGMGTSIEDCMAAKYVDSGNKFVGQSQAIKPSNPSPQKLSQEETIIRDIHTCKDITTLNAYKLIAKNNPTIKQHFESKMSELSL